MKTKRYFHWLMVAVLTITSFTVTSCKDEPDKYEIADGTPTVYYVRSPYAAQRDSLMTGAYMGNTICLVGDNLRSIVELYFNDQPAVLNTSYITDHTLLCDVPKELPNNPTDKIYMKTQSGETVSYDFAVLIPQPTVSSMSNEFAKAGEEVTIYGDYYLTYDSDPLTITMPGDIAVTDIKSITKTAVTFVIPDGVTEAGKIKVNTKYGKSESAFYYLDNRGMILDWDGTHGGLSQGAGWRPGTGLKATDDNTNFFIRFSGTPTANGWENKEDDFCFNYWPTAESEGVKNLTGIPEMLEKYSLDQLALKFECRIPSSLNWTSSALQFIFSPVNADLNAIQKDVYEDYGDDTKHHPRAIWSAYSSSGFYDTGGEWRTISIPFSNFNKTKNGEACDVDFTSEMLGTLTFYFMGGPAGTASELQMDVDNIRIAPTE